MEQTEPRGDDKDLHVEQERLIVAWNLLFVIHSISPGDPSNEDVLVVPCSNDELIMCNLPG